MPLLARIYPNGSGDVNDFHHAGGMAFTTRTLLDAGLLHDDQLTAGADEFSAYAGNPRLEGDELVWEESTETRNPEMLRPASDPFLRDGGMRLVGGNLGRAIFKTSAVSPERWTIEAPCRIFSDQNHALPLSRQASSTATWWSLSASRVRAPTACRNCTS